MPSGPKLGIIAGNGRFPFLVLDAARAQGNEVVAAANKEETSTETNAVAQPYAGFRWGTFKLIETLRRKIGTPSVVMVSD